MFDRQALGRVGAGARWFYRTIKFYSASRAKRGRLQSEHAGDFFIISRGRLLATSGRLRRRHGERSRRLARQLELARRCAERLHGLGEAAEAAGGRLVVRRPAAEEAG